jgi:hypothetical protein
MFRKSVVAMLGVVPPTVDASEPRPSRMVVNDGIGDVWAVTMGPMSGGV